METFGSGLPKKREGENAAGGTSYGTGENKKREKKAAAIKEKMGPSFLPANWGDLRGLMVKSRSVGWLLSSPAFHHFFFEFLFDLFRALMNIQRLRL